MKIRGPDRAGWCCDSRAKARCPHPKIGEADERGPDDQVALVAGQLAAPSPDTSI